VSEEPTSPIVRPEV